MDSQTFQITLGEKAFRRLDRIAKKLDAKPDELFLFLALWTLKDIECGVHHVSYYRKYLNQLEEELNYELDGNLRTKA